MILPETKVVALMSEHDIVDARLLSRDMARELGFSQSDQTLIATAISEIARNILTYAKTGEITLEAISQPMYGVVVTAKDDGPGIFDLEQAMRDGFSTGGGLGLGLPGAKRLMDNFEIRSEVGRGTTIIMTKYLVNHGMGRR